MGKGLFDKFEELDISSDEPDEVVIILFSGIINKYNSNVGRYQDDKYISVLKLKLRLLK
jgi:hypothetical protein